MLFVVYQNLYDYMSKIFEGYSYNNRTYNVILDRSCTGIMGSIRAFHNSISLNKRYNLPFKRLWYSSYVNYQEINLANEKRNEIYFIFFEGNRVAYQYEYLKYLREKYERAKFIFRFINTIDVNDLSDLRFVKKNYDMLISMDLEDCRKYGLQYLPNTFWIDETKIPLKPKSDVIFLGSDKGRLDSIIEVYRVLSSLNLNCQFFVSGIEKGKRRQVPKEIHIIKSMDYLDYLGYVKNTNCILEVVINRQKGSTLRALEAVFFNKQLITNNRYIENEDYYQQEYMHIFQKTKELCDLKDSIDKAVAYENRDKIDHKQLFSMVKNYFE